MNNEDLRNAISISRTISNPVLSHEIFKILKIISIPYEIRNITNLS